MCTCTLTHAQRKSEQTFGAEGANRTQSLTPLCILRNGAPLAIPARSAMLAGRHRWGAASASIRPNGALHFPSTHVTPASQHMVACCHMRRCMRGHSKTHLHTSTHACTGCNAGRTPCLLQHMTSWVRYGDSSAAKESYDQSASPGTWYGLESPQSVCNAPCPPTSNDTHASYG